MAAAHAGCGSEDADFRPGVDVRFAPYSAQHAKLVSAICEHGRDKPGHDVCGAVPHRSRHTIRSGGRSRQSGHPLGQGAITEDSPPPFSGSHPYGFASHAPLPERRPVWRGPDESR